MIDNYSWINTEGEGGHYGFCHRRHAVMIPYFFKGQVKSPIHHNTRDGSEFMFLTLCTLCNFRGRTWGLGRVGRERRNPWAPYLSIM